MYRYQVCGYPGLFGEVYTEEDKLIEAPIRTAENGWGSMGYISVIDFTDVDANAEAWLLSPQGMYIDNLYAKDFRYYLDELTKYLNITRRKQQ